ncbi:MAG: PD40 domain-containing protein [Planctomycetes bacterium]|nr:PD40 domain-containing protein [Planctomycetota bacterium]
MRAISVLCCVLLVSSASSGQTFRAPVPETVLNGSYGASSPTLTGDMLTIYFVSNRPGGVGGYDLYSATRPNLTAPWSIPAVEPVLSTTMNELYVDVRDDGQEIVYAIGDSAFITDLYSSTRTPTGWSAPTRITVLNDPGQFVEEADPTMSGDGLEIIFTTGRNWSRTGYDLLRSTRSTPTSPWAPPMPLSEINTTSSEHSPSLSGDGLTLIFSSTQGGGGGGRSDLWITTRPDRGALFATPRPLSELNSSDNEGNGQWTADGFQFYFSRSSGIHRADRVLPGTYPVGGVMPREAAQLHVQVRYDASSAGRLGAVVGARFRSPNPSAIPGIVGLFELDLGSLFWGQAGVLDADGQFATTPLGLFPGAMGIQLWYQGLVDLGGADLYLSPITQVTIQR